LKSADKKFDRKSKDTRGSPEFCTHRVTLVTNPVISHKQSPK
jgi:hypothetical protein